jgi:IclR family KDG regulon transcriptional repressor
MNTENIKKEKVLSSVQNALRILRCFSMEEPEKKITDLAVSMGLAKSTVSRLMSTLASEGFVVKDPVTQRYRLGVSVLALSGIVTTHLEIHREAQPILRKLVDQVGETAHLVVLEGVEVVYLHKVECNHPVRLFSHAGKKNPAYCTSSGKAILAFQKDHVVNQVIEHGLKRYTDHTITNPEELRSVLKQVNKQGYSVSIEEFMEGVSSIGIPIWDYTDQVVASITITGPSQRINRRKIPLYIKKLKESGMDLSLKLGYIPKK